MSPGPDICACVTCDCLEFVEAEGEVCPGCQVGVHFYEEEPA
jgi:hypothetical protein